MKTQTVTNSAIAAGKYFSYKMKFSISLKSIILVAECLSVVTEENIIGATLSEIDYLKKLLSQPVENVHQIYFTNLVSLILINLSCHENDEVQKNIYLNVYRTINLPTNELQDFVQRNFIKVSNCYKVNNALS